MQRCAYLIMPCTIKGHLVHCDGSGLQPLHFTVFWQVVTVLSRSWKSRICYRDDLIATRYLIENTIGRLENTMNMNIPSLYENPLLTYEYKHFFEHKYMKKRNTKSWFVLLQQSINCVFSLWFFNCLIVMQTLKVFSYIWTVW